MHRFPVLIATLCFAFAAHAQIPEETVSEPEATVDVPEMPETDGPPDLTDRAHLEAFIDGLVAAHQEANNIAGATVSVVKNGEVLLTKGYGYADVEARTPVDGETTLFRIGSVSKLFVWTAIMQLVEQGRLDLQTDVNTYLTDVKVPKKYGTPITMTHLMTHTPGFEDAVIGLFRKDESGLRPLAEVLQDEMPKRVRPPGELASYSNHGTGLAMLVVESITGQPWNQYLQEHIIQPLDMQHTTFTQPVPEAMAADLSKGYAWQNQVFVEKDFEFIPLAPVGACSAAAGDMAKFMIAHLQYGAYGDGRILEEATARRMHSDLFKPHPRLNGMAHGFIEASQNGVRAIGHGGDTFWFHTQCVLIPEADAGVFVSFNTQQGGAATGPFIEEFFDHYFPGPEESGVEDVQPEDVARYAGTYRLSRYSHTTLAKLSALMSTINVRVTEDDTLKTSATGDVEFEPIAPGVFQERRGDRELAFLSDDAGNVTHFYFNEMPIIAVERAEGIHNPRLQGAVLAFCLVVFLLTIVLWPLAALARWYYDVLQPRSQRVPVLARLLGWVTAVTFIAFPIALIFALPNGPEDIAFGETAGVKMAIGLNHLGIVLTLLCIVYTVRIWRQGFGRIRSRLYFTILNVAFLLFISLTVYWNLVLYRGL